MAQTIKKYKNLKVTESTHKKVHAIKFKKDYASVDGVIVDLLQNGKIKPK